MLVVDDDIDSAELLQELLQAEGCEVTLAHDGPQALSSATVWRPDLVLLDIHLRSAMDGYDVCRELAASSERPRRIIALTGPFGSDDNQIREAGFDGQIQKPTLDTNRILELLEDTVSCCCS